MMVAIRSDGRLAEIQNKLKMVGRKDIRVRPMISAKYSSFKDHSSLLLGMTN